MHTAFAGLLRTSIYHPQTEELIERSNQNLRRILYKMVDEEGQKWDLLLP